MTTNGYSTLVLAMSLAACAPGPEAGDEPKEAERLSGPELDGTLSNTDVLLLDVREAHELQDLGTVEGHLHIPIDQLPDRLGELPRDKPILTA